MGGARTTGTSLLLALVLSLGLAGCQLLPPGEPRVPYDQGVVKLQSGWPYTPGQWLQHATLSVEDGTREFVLSLYLQDEAVTLVAMTAAGHTLFRVDLDEAGVDVSDAERLPDPRFPLRVLAEMQLALWPVESLQENVQGLYIEERFQPEWQRVVYSSAGEVILTITGERPASKAEVIRMRHADYSLTIVTLEREDLD